MDLNAMKERFSFAYVEAVASQAGYWIADPRVDRWSVDGILMGDTVGLPRLDFQLKATSRDVVRGEHLHFPLPIGNYNDLRLQARAARILIVLQLPENVEEWINQSRDEMCQRYCAYWLSLRNRPPVANTTSVTVEIPLSNMFNSSQLAELMSKASLGEPL